MMNKDVLQELSTKISRLIDYHLGADHIHYIQEDGSGYYYYIQNLKPGYPVLAMHYRGTLMLVLPFRDAHQLSTREVSVDDYIKNSHFNYGYYWGGGSMISGGYWQPLEDKTGIHNRGRICRYLHILYCRTSKVSCGYDPREERCRKCPLDATKCPFSPLNQTGTWENEVQETDRRLELFQAINSRLEAELGFSISSRISHNGDRNDLILIPGLEPDTVIAHVNRDLLNDLLYHPDEVHDWKQMAQNFTIVLAKKDWSSRIKLPKGDREACLEFWRPATAEGQHVEANQKAQGEFSEPSTAVSSLRSIKLLGLITDAWKKTTAR